MINMHMKNGMKNEWNEYQLKSFHVSPKKERKEQVMKTPLYVYPLK